jgi:hypothetical protein
VSQRECLARSAVSIASLRLDLANVVERLDEMFDKEQFQKAFEYIEQNKGSPSFQSYYVQWRVARFD